DAHVGRHVAGGDRHVDVAELVSRLTDDVALGSRETTVGAAVCDGQTGGHEGCGEGHADGETQGRGVDGVHVGVTSCWLCPVRSDGMSPPWALPLDADMVTTCSARSLVVSGHQVVVKWSGARCGSCKTHSSRPTWSRRRSLPTPT